MSSSQSANTTTILGSSPPYAYYSFTTRTIRDSSDWIRYKKEARKFANYKSSSTDNKDTEPVWLKYGNQFRLTYSFGRYKCETTDCAANAFSGVVGGETNVG